MARLARIVIFSHTAYPLPARQAGRRGSAHMPRHEREYGQPRASIFTLASHDMSPPAHRQHAIGQHIADKSPEDGDRDYASC